VKVPDHFPSLHFHKPWFLFFAICAFLKFLKPTKRKLKNIYRIGYFSFFHNYVVECERSVKTKNKEK